MISVVASLCLLVFGLQGYAQCNANGHTHSGGGGGGGVISWFDGL